MKRAILTEPIVFHRVFRLGPLLISRTSWYSRERKLFMAANDIVFQ